MTLLDMALKCHAPQVMSVRRIQVLRRGIHNKEFIAKRALTCNSANLSEECDVICHELSMYRRPQKRNLR